MAADLHVFGIRHHGPGSARSLLAALETAEPDAVLVEGPPDADDLLELLDSPDLEPPVAILVYRPDEPQLAVIYPFATFSPEWVALRYARGRGIAVRFMDLPQAHRLASPGEKEVEAVGEAAAQEEAESPGRPAPREDPLGKLAEIAGFADSERWWDHLVESRGGHAAVFAAITEAMVAVREDHDGDDTDEARREAFMRKTIRAVAKEGHERIAVVCGAWHVPALRDPWRKGSVSEDNATLKGLPRAKTAAAWTPWSYDRLCFRSGYGAGVESPAYYDLLWRDDGRPAVRWLTEAARLLRAEDLDASSAHVIEAVRLSETLATLRGRPLPGLAELDEAAMAVMGLGAEAPMRLIRRRLVIGDRLGRVPDIAPLVPLQKDLQQLQKRLRMPVSGDEKDYDLDLRKPMDLDRSHLLHRLNLLGAPWGERRERYGQKGTFHEPWRVRWDPAFVVPLIEKARWGTTIEEAAGALVVHIAEEVEDLAILAERLDDVLLAELPRGVAALIRAIRDRAATSGDTGLLMDTLPALARVSRYGNVRSTDVSMVLGVVHGLVPRICAGLPVTTASLDDDAARQLLQRIEDVHRALNLLEEEMLWHDWLEAMLRLADQSGLHPLIAGRAVRLLHEAGNLDPEEVGRRLGLGLSRAVDPIVAAAWLEGFLSGSGLLLLHDDVLWNLVDEWICSLRADAFTEVLPLVRRTFSSFPVGERRQMGSRVLRGKSTAPAVATPQDFDFASGRAVVPLLERILGNKKEKG